MKSRTIEDFFGDKLSSVEKWESSREEIKNFFLDTEYGALPCELTYKTTKESQPVNFAGKAEWEAVFFEFTNGEKFHTVRTELILPKNKENTPVFVYIDFSKETPSKYLPVEEILDGGFGIFKVYYEDVTTDNGDFENGLCALFGKGDYGKISVWSYMLRTMASYLDTKEGLGKYAVIGHSRLGKTAMLTAALDTRFDLACINNSGCCGASLFHGKSEGNEKIKEITDVFPFWFTKGFKNLAGKEDTLPFDQHLLLGLIAPRSAVIGCAREDVWADNEGAFYCVAHAMRVWELYNHTANKILGHASAYIREGSHFLSRYDWNVYMTKFKELIDEFK